MPDLLKELLPLLISTKKSLGEGSIHRPWLHKCIPNTHSKLVLTKANIGNQICTKLTFILFEEVLKSIELLFWVRGRSLEQQLPARCSKIFAFRLSEILLFAWHLVSEKFSQLKLRIHRLPIVSSTNISRIAVLLSQNFKNRQSTTRFAKFIQTGSWILKNGI